MSLALLDHRLPPGPLDVVLQLDAERPVVPDGVDPAVDLGAGEDEAAPLREADDRLELGHGGRGHRRRGWESRSRVLLVSIGRGMDDRGSGTSGAAMLAERRGGDGDPAPTREDHARVSVIRIGIAVDLRQRGRAASHWCDPRPVLGEIGRVVADRRVVGVDAGLALDDDDVAARAVVAKVERDPRIGLEVARSAWPGDRRRRRSRSPTQRNQTGIVWGWPAGVTVVSQPIMSRAPGARGRGRRARRPGSKIMVGPSASLRSRCRRSSPHLTSPVFREAVAGRRTSSRRAPRRPWQLDPEGRPRRVGPRRYSTSASSVARP